MLHLVSVPGHADSRIEIHDIGFVGPRLVPVGPEQPKVNVRGYRIGQASAYPNW
jgi:hypothetical protein